MYCTSVCFAIKNQLKRYLSIRLIEIELTNDVKNKNNALQCYDYV